MIKNKVIDKYFERLEKNSNCKSIDEISGINYSIIEKNKKSEIKRLLIDDNLDVAISKIKNKKVCDIDYINGSDLLIIGFCLNGEKVINYKGKHIIKEGEVFYFRPTDDFSIEFFKSDFIYYFLDLNYFRKFMECKNYNCHCKKKNCNSYVDHICEKGEVFIEKVPYAMKSYKDEIMNIQEVEIHNFLDYSILKGQLFNYLNWFIKSRLKRKKRLNRRKYGICYAKKAKELIRDNLDEEMTVKEISEILGISIYRLQKSFKNSEGTTVYNYMLNEKINTSKTLLEETDLSILDISLKIGYENPSKFSTAFKNITELTPTEYRTKNRKK